MNNKLKNKKASPILTIIILIAIIILLSGLGDFLNLQTSYLTVNYITGNVENQLVEIDSIFNRTGLQFIISNMVNNFTSFTPFVNLIVALLGIGVAYQSGFLLTLFKLIKKRIPKKVITFIIIFLGIITSMFLDAAYVILIPLSAILFISMKRNPKAGICAAFAGITFGYGTNIVVTGLDLLLKPYTKSATSILDTSYKIGIDGNIIATILASLLISYVGMFVTEKYIIPKVGKYNLTEEQEEEINSEVTSKEKKGLSLSIITIIFLTLITIYCIIPGLPFSGLLLDLKAENYIGMLFGEGSYFNQGIVFILSTFLMIAGLIYGLRVKNIESSQDFFDSMGHYLKNISSILVLMFFASQLISIFKKSNLGIFITAFLSQGLNSIEITGIVLIIITFIIVIISSLFIPSSTTKWAILAPVVIPLFMQSSMTPEFATLIFRAGDNILKGVTPLFSYFILLIGFLQIYKQKENEVISIKDTMSLMIPYSIAMTILWILIFLAFYIINIPLSPTITPIF